SLIYRDPRIPTLAPAYDLVSTLPYGYPDDLGMPFLGTDRPEDITLKLFTDLERKLDVKADLTDLAREVVERVAMAWPEHAASLAALPHLRDRIGEHITAAARQLFRQAG
ncbi:MAG TPA: type II toxin-antitoxin system HipA family toxin, partial [Pseudonocardiaceae bacterium]|nr:type II toxin-antitoxin system HipA family toxin [Pseudonocardiaceae bacterium]